MSDIKNIESGSINKSTKNTTQSTEEKIQRTVGDKTHTFRPVSKGRVQSLLTAIISFVKSIGSRSSGTHDQIHPNDGLKEPASITEGVTETSPQGASKSANNIQHKPNQPVEEMLDTLSGDRNLTHIQRDIQQLRGELARYDGSTIRKGRIERRVSAIVEGIKRLDYDHSISPIDLKSAVQTAILDKDVRKDSAIQQDLLNQLLKPKESIESIDPKRQTTKCLDALVGKTTVADINGAILATNNDYKQLPNLTQLQQRVRANKFRAMIHFGVFSRSIHTFLSPKNGQLTVTKENETYTVMLQSTERKHMFSNKPTVVSISFVVSDDGSLTLISDGSNIIKSYLKNMLNVSDSFSKREEVQRAFLNHLCFYSAKQNTPFTFSAPGIDFTYLAGMGVKELIDEELGGVDEWQDSVRDVRHEIIRAADEKLTALSKKIATNLAKKATVRVAKVGVGALTAGVFSEAMGGVDDVRSAIHEISKAMTDIVDQLNKVSFDVPVEIDTSTLSSLEDTLGAISDQIDTLTHVDEDAINKLKTCLQAIKNKSNTLADKLKAEAENDLTNLENILNSSRTSWLKTTYVWFTSADKERHWLFSKIKLDKFIKKDIVQLDKNSVLQRPKDYRNNGNIILTDKGNIGVNVRKKGWLPFNQDASRNLLLRRMITWGPRLMKLAYIAPAITGTLVSIGLVTSVVAWPIAIGIVAVSVLALGSVALYSYLNKNDPPTRGFLALPETNPSNRKQTKDLLTILQFLPDQQLNDFGRDVLGKKAFKKSDLVSFANQLDGFQKELQPNDQTISYAMWIKELQMDTIKQNLAQTLDVHTNIVQPKSTGLSPRNTYTSDIKSNWQDVLNQTAGSQKVVTKKTLAIVANAIVLHCKDTSRTDADGDADGSSIAIDATNAKLMDSFSTVLANYLMSKETEQTTVEETFIKQLINGARSTSILGKFEKHSDDTIDALFNAEFIEKTNEKIASERNRIKTAKKSTSIKKVTNRLGRVKLVETAIENDGYILTLNSEERDKLREAIKSKCRSLNQSADSIDTLRKKCKTFIVLHQLVDKGESDQDLGQWLKTLNAGGFTRKGIPLPTIDSNNDLNEGLNGLIKELEADKFFHKPLSTVSDNQVKTTLIPQLIRALKIRPAKVSQNQQDPNQPHTSLMTKVAVGRTQKNRSSATEAAKNVTVSRIKSTEILPKTDDDMRTFANQTLAHLKGSTKSIEAFAQEGRYKESTKGIEAFAQGLYKQMKQTPGDINFFLSQTENVRNLNLKQDDKGAIQELRKHVYRNYTKNKNAYMETHYPGKKRGESTITHMITTLQQAMDCYDHTDNDIVTHILSTLNTAKKSDSALVKAFNDDDKYPKSAELKNFLQNLNIESLTLPEKTRMFLEGLRKNPEGDNG